MPEYWKDEYDELAEQQAARAAKKEPSKSSFSFKATPGCIVILILGLIAITSPLWIPLIF